MASVQRIALRSISMALGFAVLVPIGLLGINWRCLPKRHRCIPFHTSELGSKKRTKRGSLPTNMSIAEFYISNGIDPWNHRALERWIGSNIGFSTRRSHDLELSEFQIDDIAEKEGWEKLQPDDGAEFALD